MDMKKIINEGIERCVKPLTEKFFKLEEEHNALRQSFFKLEGQHHIIDQSFDVLEGEHHVLKQRIEEIEKRSVPKNRVPELEKTILGLRLRNVDLECKIKDMKENADYCLTDKLEKTILDLQFQKAELERKIKDLKENVDTNLVDRLEGSIIKLRAQNANFKAKIKDLETELELMKEKPSEKGKEKCENSEGSVESDASSDTKTTPVRVYVPPIPPNKEFMIAIENGMEDRFSELLKRGLNLNMRDGVEGYTPLMRACAQNRVRFVMALLEKGVEVNAQTGNGLTALMLCHGDSPVTRLLLEGGANPNLCDRDGETALMCACENGNAKGMLVLLKYGANADIKCNKGMTALMYAAAGNHLSMVKILLVHGVDKSVKDGYERDAIEIAKSFGYDEIATVIAKYPRCFP